MLRALRFIFIAAVLLGLAWWIGTIPGSVTAHSGTYTVQASVPVAILILALIVVILTISLRIFGGLRRAPGGYGNWRGGRRQKLGEAATQRGIVALAAGDAKTAEAEASKARKLQGDTPLALLLTAESAQLSGKHEQAQAAFRRLAANKDMAFLGHRGLVRHSIAQGDHEAADAHALAAEAAYPGSAWLQTKRLDIAVKKQDWRAALGLTRKPAEIAALATAAANNTADAKQAFIFAKQAVKADPALAPAIAAYAVSLRKTNRARAAKRALLKGWSLAPHPLIAKAYLEPLYSPIERAQAAADLAASKPGDKESELLLAETALAAKLTGEAKRHAQAAIDAGLKDKRPYTVLGALEDGQAALAAMALAPAPGWSCTACHAEHAEWNAACPNCFKPGTLVWKAASKALVAV